MSLPNQNDAELKQKIADIWGLNKSKDDRYFAQTGFEKSKRVEDTVALINRARVDEVYRFKHNNQKRKVYYISDRLRELGVEVKSAIPATKITMDERLDKMLEFVYLRFGLPFYWHDAAEFAGYKVSDSGGAGQTMRKSLDELVEVGYVTVDGLTSGKKWASLTLKGLRYLNKVKPELKIDKSHLNQTTQEEEQS